MGVVVSDCDDFVLSVIVDVADEGLGVHMGERRAAGSLHDAPGLLRRGIGAGDGVDIVG